MAVTTVYLVDDSGDTRELPWDDQGTTAEISQDGESSWLLKSAFGHELHCERMDPVGQWEEGLMVTPVLEFMARRGSFGMSR